MANPVDYVAVETLYDGGHTDNDIARLLSISRISVYLWRDRHSLPPHPSTEPRKQRVVNYVTGPRGPMTEFEMRRSLLNIMSSGRLFK